ncbi:Probable secreted protein [[Actinomadura] parvosata subsp. kistnae]|uniref:endonuclease/exonuclease/phosphatase family protein n=1 Tax=[Actinomadura] parvosata TaxID=1955412 RepID=UPI000D283F36|nr:Probable secreted protein [Actinomadura parvosata subsp. kistnae]
MRTLARSLAALTTIAVLLLPGGAAHADDPAVETVRMWQWNVAGWTMNDGSATTGMVKAAAASIKERNADFAAFNELCWDQYKAIQATLGKLGWPQGASFSRFAPIRNEVAGTEGACGGERFGIAIFSRRDIGSAVQYALPQDNEGGVHKLLCVSPAARPHLRFCTTHITASNEIIDGEYINRKQLAEVLGHLQTFHDAGDTVLIGGDFNARPQYSRLDTWYAPSLDVPNNGGNTGQYRELDDLEPACPGIGETTVGEVNGKGKPIGLVPPCNQRPKIDLLFAQESAIVGSYTGDSLEISTACGGPCSDHRIVVGTVSVRIQP